MLLDVIWIFRMINASVSKLKSEKELISHLISGKASLHPATRHYPGVMLAVKQHTVRLCPLRGIITPFPLIFKFYFDIKHEFYWQTCLIFINHTCAWKPVYETFLCTQHLYKWDIFSRSHRARWNTERNSCCSTMTQQTGTQSNRLYEDLLYMS